MINGTRPPASSRRSPSAPHRGAWELIRAGTLDAELAATVWLLVGGRVPLIVAGDGRGIGKSTLHRALLDFLPPDTRVVELAGIDETFEWLRRRASSAGREPPELPSTGRRSVRRPR